MAPSYSLDDEQQKHPSEEIQRFQRFAAAIAGQFNNPEHSDLTIWCGLNTRIHAHRVILCPQSTWFQEQVAAERGHRKAVVRFDPDEHTWPAVELFVKYFYTSDVEVSLIMDTEISLSRLEQVYKLAWLCDVAELRSLLRKKHALVLTEHCCSDKTGFTPLLLAESLERVYEDERPWLHGLRETVLRVAAPYVDDIRGEQMLLAGEALDDLVREASGRTDIIRMSLVIDG